MIGPIPGQPILSWTPEMINLFNTGIVTLLVSVSLDHEGLYYNLRTNFEARGRVRFMFIHKVQPFLLFFLRWFMANACLLDYELRHCVITAVIGIW